MLDDDFFAGLGQDLSEDQKQTIANNVYSELEERVGDKLEEQLGEAKYDEFEKAVSQDDDDVLDAWLSKNAPGYDQLVDITLAQLKQEVAQDLAKFLQADL